MAKLGSNLTYGRHAKADARFRQIVCVLALSIALSAGVWSHAVADYRIQPRAECVVALDIVYAPMPVWNLQAGNISLSFARYSRNPASRIPDSRVAVATRTRWHLLFQDRCAQRYVMAKSLLAAHRRQFPAQAAISINTATLPANHFLAGLKFFVSKPKFRRRDCIVAVDVRKREPNSWKPPDGTPYVLDFIMKHGINAYPHVAPFSFSWPNRRRLYLQFDDFCDRRIGMAKFLFTAYMQRHDDGRIYEVKLDKFDPGPRTLDVRGYSWIDGF